MDLDIMVVLCFIVVLIAIIAAVSMSNTDIQIHNFQTVNMNVTPSGYEPNVIHIKANKPIVWNINVIGLSGCNDKIMMKDHNSFNLHEGRNKFELSPFNAGTVEFTCGMGMMKGEFVVE
jgi:plastocyanin domain-containing protein